MEFIIGKETYFRHTARHAIINAAVYASTEYDTAADGGGAVREIAGDLAKTVFAMGSQQETERGIIVLIQR